MARRSTGQVIPPTGKARSWAIRFRAYGERQYVTLGRPEDGWTRQRAEAELRHVLADVERGIWRPDEPEEPEAPKAALSFHKFASDWLRQAEPGLRPKTVKDYKWALELHLLPWFARLRLDEITVEQVDRYRTAKLRERKLGPNAINKTLTRLAQILDTAIEYELMDRNPAKSKRRRAKGTQPKRSWVEPEQLPSLLDAADGHVRPVLVTLAGAGLRIGEAVALDWRDLDLATGTLTVPAAKTAAGEGRQVDLPDDVRRELAAWKLRSPRSQVSDPAFVSRARDGKHARQTQRNIQARIKTAIRAANERLNALGIEQISERVTPHSLRRTYASLRFALGDDPVYVAEQLGHSEHQFSMRVYARAIKRRERLTGEHLAQFDGALEWAELGRIDAEGPERPVSVKRAEVENPAS